MGQEVAVSPIPASLAIHTRRQILSGESVNRFIYSNRFYGVTWAQLRHT